MSSPEERVEFARRGLEAWQRRDLDAIVAMLHPEVETKAPVNMLMADPRSGPEGLLAFAAQWLEPWEEITDEVVSLDPVGDDHVVATLLQSARGKGSGVEVENTVFFMYEIHDGRATRIHAYGSFEAAEAAALAGEADRASSD